MRMCTYYEIKIDLPVFVRAELVEIIYDEIFVSRQFQSFKAARIVAVFAAVHQREFPFAFEKYRVAAADIEKMYPVSALASVVPDKSKIVFYR